MLDNAAIAELLIREAEAASDHRERAFQGAARAALMWPEEAADLAHSGRSLTELEGVGPSMAKRLHRWLQKPPTVDPPEIRREFLTLAAARRVLAKHPAWRPRLRGDLQMHTTWSDGSGSISEMVAGAVERKYQYIAITDHTQGLSIANGLDEARLKKQGAEIGLLNAQLKKMKIDFTILRATEMNLSPAGVGDMKSSALAKLDLVLGCFHSDLRTTADQTPRYLSGLRNLDIHILGHPQTRMYNRRVGLKADWGRVFGEAARLGKAVEIDGYADRQDLRVSLLKVARREGVHISLGTDAHEPRQLEFMDLALAAARLAKIPAERILNFHPLASLQAWVSDIRGR